MGIDFSKRARAKMLVRLAKDAAGNQDGLADNEGKPKGKPRWYAFKNPLWRKLCQVAGSGLSAAEDRQFLRDFVSQRENRWGKPVSTLMEGDPSQGGIRDVDLFRAEKAVALTRFDRTPLDVTEFLVHARGSVDGQLIDDRNLFVQRWRPISESSGKVVVVSPGFQETGRSFYEQIQELNRAGADVLVMDHQWAGYSEGSPGGLDRGFGVARDVARVAVEASRIVDADYGEHPDRQVVLFGNSMGAGPGVLGAVTLNDRGLIKLDGSPQMPEGLSMILQAPYLAATPNWKNKLLSWFSTHFLLVTHLRIWSPGWPPLTADPVAAVKLAQHVSAEDIRAQLSAMSSATKDLARICAMQEEPPRPAGRLSIVHADRDPLANPESSRALKAAWGEQARLDLFPGRNHVIEEEPGAQDRFMAGFEWVTGGKATTRVAPALLRAS